MLNLTPEQIKALKDNSVYQYYENIPYSSITVAKIESDLDAIQRTSIENWPLIAFLKALYNSKTEESQVDILNTIDADTGSIKAYLADVTKELIPYSGTDIPSLLTAWDVYRQTGTASSGSLSLTQLAAQASKTWWVHAFWFYNANATNPDTSSFDLEIKSGTTGTVIVDTRLSQKNQGKIHYVGMDSTDAGESVKFDITNSESDCLWYMFCQAGYR